MGLNLSGGKKSKAEKAQRTKEARAPKKGKAKRAKAIESPTVNMEEPDEELDLNTVEPEESSPVATIAAFEGGFVHPVLSGAVNAHWRKSEESTLFRDVLAEIMTVEGAFFGNIYVRTSFMRRTGGQALL